MKTPLSVKEFIKEIEKQENSEGLKIAGEIGTLSEKEIKVIPLKRLCEYIKEENESSNNQTRWTHRKPISK